MTLHPPFSISSRLMPALKIGSGTLSLDYGRTDQDGRVIWNIWLDLPSGEYEITDLRSGCGNATLQSGFAALCSFLSAAAESRDYRERTGRQGENEDLFSPEVVDWASEYSDELSMYSCDLDEHPNLIEE